MALSPIQTATFIAAGIIAPAAGGVLLEQVAAQRFAAPHQTVGVPTAKNATRTKSRLKFRVPKRVTGARFWYTNRRIDLTAGEVAGPNPVDLLKVAVEVAGVTVPVTFSGSRAKTWPTTTVLEPSDWVNVDIPAGTTAFYRQIAAYTSHATASYVCQRLYNVADLEGASAEQSWVYDPAYETDDVDGTGAMAVPGGTASANWTANYVPFQPVAMTARFSDGTEAWMLVGDSIAFGLNDLPSSDASNGDGLVARGLRSANVPFTRYALSGHSVQQIVNPNCTLLRALMALHKGVVSEAGTNDIASGPTAAATVYARKQAEWDLYRAAGLKIVQTRLPPRVSAPPLWVVPGSVQTPASGFATGANRDELNAFYATALSGGLIQALADIATPVEDPTDRSKWANSTFSATLAQTAATTATSLVLSAAPPVGARLVVDYGGANQAPNPANAVTRVNTVSGSGPYTVTFSSAIGGAGTHQVGEAVVQAVSDGTHPEGVINATMAIPVANAVTALR